MTKSKPRMPCTGTQLPGRANPENIPAGNNINILIRNTFRNIKPLSIGAKRPGQHRQRANLRRSGIRLSPDYPIQPHSSTKRQGSQSETGSKQQVNPTQIRRICRFFFDLILFFSCKEISLLEKLQVSQRGAVK